jgi:hypothetical protein
MSGQPLTTLGIKKGLPMYFRKSNSTLFLLPAIAVGMENGAPFLEFAWLCWAVGFGENK